MMRELLVIYVFFFFFFIRLLFACYVDGLGILVCWSG